MEQGAEYCLEKWYHGEEVQISFKLSCRGWRLLEGSIIWQWFLIVLERAQKE